MKNKGSLIVEIMISSAIGVATLLSLSFLVFQVQFMLGVDSFRIEALKLADNKISSSTFAVGSVSSGNFLVDTQVEVIDSFTKKVIVDVSYFIKNRKVTVSLSKFITDITESRGQSSCRPSQDMLLWKNPRSSFFNMGISSQNIQATDIDIVGSYAYITSNTASSTDPDFLILDISDISHPIVLSSIDTGPGLLSLHVVDNYAYVGNTSINGQLQIINISNKNNPYLISTYKLPGNYNDATTVGNVVFYKTGKIYLGTQKSQTKELHVIDVLNPTSPYEMSSFEVGGAINDIFVFKEMIYVATPNTVELKIFSLVSNILTLISNYDPLGASGNGKRLFLFSNQLYLGRAIGENEFYVLNTDNLPPALIFKYSINSSIQGLIAYRKLIFMALSNKNDGFVVFNTATSSISRISTSPIIFPASPLNFDCDKDMFGIIFEKSNVISFITHS